VAEDGPGDTIYQNDKVSEALLLERLEPEAARLGGVVLVAEGLPGGELVLPRGRTKPSAWRFIVDPIDGTRGIMYQKRSAWVLGAVAPNRGEETRLGDIVVAAQTEIPTQKQHLSDELWAVRGRGANLQRYNRLTHTLTTLPVRPSRGQRRDLEIPTQKQHLSDELWAVRGRGANLQRYNRLTHTLTTLPVRPSRGQRRER